MIQITSKALLDQLCQQADEDEIPIYFKKNNKEYVILTEATFETIEYYSDKYFGMLFKAMYKAAQNDQETAKKFEVFIHSIMEEEYRSDQSDFLNDN